MHDAAVHLGSLTDQPLPLPEGGPPPHADDAKRCGRQEKERHGDFPGTEFAEEQRRGRQGDASKGGP